MVGSKTDRCEAIDASGPGARCGPPEQHAGDSLASPVVGYRDRDLGRSGLAGADVARDPDRRSVGDHRRYRLVVEVVDAR